jgi:hypothetical protein
MGKSKGEELNKQILAKLMLLEYFKSETFKTYYEQQAQNQGLIPSINVLEEMAKTDEIEDEILKNLSVDQQAILQDPWIKRWLSSDPSLIDIDLQPYFYFSRDKLSVSGINLQRMSSQAQEVFRKLLSDSEAIRNSALVEAKSISVGDASSIFESLTEKLKREEKQTGDTPTLKRIVDFCSIRNELISQLLSFIEKLPHHILPISSITWILEVTEGTNYKQIALKILNVWSTSITNKHLATIAAKKLKTIS